jgi:hypothetical protein
MHREEGEGNSKHHTNTRLESLLVRVIGNDHARVLHQRRNIGRLAAGRSAHVCAREKVREREREKERERELKSERERER